MNPDELDLWLRKHTESEEHYLAHDAAYIAKRQKEVVGIDDGMMRVPLRAKILTGGNRFIFKKHSRFLDYPEHVHDWVELEYMYAGSCVQHLNGTPVRLAEGQSILVDQNTRHKVPLLGEDQILLNLSTHALYAMRDAGGVTRAFGIAESLGTHADRVTGGGFCQRCGAKVEEIQVNMRKRMAGHSYFNFSSIFKYMVRVCSSILFMQWFREKENL